MEKAETRLAIERHLVVEDGFSTEMGCLRDPEAWRVVPRRTLSRAFLCESVLSERRDALAVIAEKREERKMGHGWKSQLIIQMGPQGGMQ